jgi:hypothetical protein
MDTIFSHAADAHMRAINIRHKCQGMSFSHAANAHMRRIQIPTQVSGHEFTHAAKSLKKSNSLLPQAPGSPACAAFAHAGVEAAHHH